MGGEPGDGLQRTTCRGLGMVGCAALDKNLRIAFGYKAKYHTNNSGNGYCITDFDKRGENYNPKNTLVYQDKNIKIDNFKFEKLQLRYIDDLKFLLERYVTNEISNQIPNAKISTFRCTDGFKTWQRGLTERDDLISCFITFDGQQSSQEIEFVFDDINEAIDLTARGGTDGLRCLAGNGGKYLGGQCHGITKQQCDQLNRASIGGAVWDTTLETCTLKDGVAASDLDRAAKIAKIVGTGAAVVAITVATGGTATTVIISVTATSLGTAAQVQKNIITDQCNEQIAYGQQVKRNISKCAKKYPYNDIDGIEQCFGENLQKFINTAGLCIHENAADSATVNAYIETFDEIIGEINNELSPMASCYFNYTLVKEFGDRTQDLDNQIIALRATEITSTLLGIYGGIKAVQGLSKSVLNFAHDPKISISGNMNNVVKSLMRGRSIENNIENLPATYTKVAATGAIVFGSTEWLRQRITNGDIQGDVCTINGNQ
ncbi:MAG: hypothetical protein MJ187_02565 [Alphaproteobacteria bacterium]|nr:hypothetical protein [Alphaproteobacteria bacterium]